MLSAARRVLARTMGRVDLEVVVFEITAACNSRCVGCGHREPSPGELGVDDWIELARQARALGADRVLLTGGEPLVHREIEALLNGIAQTGLAIDLHTNGVVLHRHSDLVRATCAAVYVSVDSVDAQTYARLRGVDALGPVRRGIEALGDRVHVRVTVWRDNVDSLVAIADDVQAWGAGGLSVLAPDVSGTSFQGLVPDSAQVPSAEQMPSLRAELRRLAQHPLLRQSQPSLWRVADTIEALHGLRTPRSPRCRAPWTSCVVTPTGGVQPCFFLAGTTGVDAGLAAAVAGQRSSRRRLDVATNEACLRCVCWR